MTALLYAAPPDMCARNKVKCPHSSHKQDYIQSDFFFRKINFNELTNKTNEGQTN